jgi:hypothetical protein
MAATALDCITAAMRKLRILPSGGTPSAAETEDCLAALNDMLAAWRISGIDLAQPELASSDVIDVPDNHIEAIKANLAVRIAEDFGAQIGPALASAATGSRAALAGYHFSITDLTDDNPLARSNLSNTD